MSSFLNNDKLAFFRNNQKIVGYRDGQKVFGSPSQQVLVPVVSQATGMTSVIRNGIAVAKGYVYTINANTTATTTNWVDVTNTNVTPHTTTRITLTDGTKDRRGIYNVNNKIWILNFTQSTTIVVLDPDNNHAQSTITVPNEARFKGVLYEDYFYTFRYYGTVNALDKIHKVTQALATVPFQSTADRWNIAATNGYICSTRGQTSTIVDFLRLSDNNLSTVTFPSAIREFFIGLNGVFHFLRSTGNTVDTIDTNNNFAVGSYTISGASFGQVSIRENSLFIPRYNTSNLLDFRDTITNTNSTITLATSHPRRAIGYSDNVMALAPTTAQSFIDIIKWVPQ